MKNNLRDHFKTGKQKPYHTSVHQMRITDELRKRAEQENLIQGKP